MQLRLAIVSFALFASPAAAQVMIYDNGPRIIHVTPQGNAYGATHAMPATSDDEIIERIERRKTQPRRPLAKPAEPAPKPRAELPPANEPKRAVLTAPPPAVGAGSLTPIYPTPRWRNIDPPPLPTNID